MADETTGEGYTRNFDRRLDRMNDFLQSLTDSMLLQHRLATERHELVMEEIAAQRGEISELLALQREHRIDIMALFELSKRARETKSEPNKPPGA